MAWLYVPAPEGSSLVSTSPSPDTEVCATSSGKVTPRPLSWRGWKSRPWVRLLSGTTLPPSTAARGVASWISSLRASRASRSALPGSSAGRRTSDGSGPISSASFGRFNPDGSFLRTSLDLFGTDSDPSSVDWPRSGTMQSGICSARARSVPHIAVSGSSYSRGEYPTPSATPYGTSQNEGQVPHKRPTAGTPSLETWAKENWSTPEATVRDSPARRTPAPGRAEGTRHGESLHHQVARWPTPRAEDSESSGARKSRGVEEQTWPSPGANDWKGSSQPGQRRGQLDEAAEQRWPTPTASDASGAGSRNTATSKAHAGVSLTDAVLTGGSTGRQGSDRRSSPPVLTISSCGPECSPKHRRLNPAFVEMLMGWPTGWSIARIGCGPSATALSLYRRRMRYALSRLVQGGS